MRAPEKALVDIDFTEDVMPLSAFRGTIADCILKTRRTHRPILVTQNGRAASVFVDIADFQRMREAIQNRNGAEAAARFDEHLRAVNTYYELGMDLSYLPEPEVQPQVNEEQVVQPEVNEEQVNQPEVNQESVIQPEVQPEVNQAENETSGSESTEEAESSGLGPSSSARATAGTARAMVMDRADAEMARCSLLM